MRPENLFPDEIKPAPLVGIARLAAEGQTISEGHKVEYISLENRSMLTKCQSRRMPFTWMINPYRGCEFACKYCYARYTHEFMELRDGLDFERKIYVKEHAGWLLRQELRQVHPGQGIAIGTATDPYQPAERRFGVTRAILEELAQHQGLSLGLVTKSDLILRDLALLQAIAAKNRLGIHVTITTLNTELARLLEPRAPRPDLRLKTVRKLVEAGIHTSINCAPVLPGITDAPSDLETLVRAAAEAGAHSVAAMPLFLKPCSEKIFLPFLQENFPSVVDSYKARFAKRSFLPPQYGRRISALIRKFAIRYRLGVPRKPVTRHSGAAVPTPGQLRLFAG